MAKKQKKDKPNNYQEFQGKFEDFVKYNQGAGEVYKTGVISPALSDLTTSLVDDAYAQNYIGNISDPKTLVKLLSTAAEQRKTNANEFAKNSLEAILKDAPEEDVKIGLMYVIEPKDKYTGSNAKLYQQVAGLQKKFKKLNEVEPDKREEKIKENYKNKYKKDKDKYEIIETLMKVDKGFAQGAYQYMLQEKQKEIFEKVKGKETDYLKQNLDGKDFIEFYGKLMSVKEKIAERANRQ